MLLLAACEKPITADGGKDDGNVVLTFRAGNGGVTRGTVSVGDYFTKLNVMVFDAQGNKALDKVKTQTLTDDGFGQMSVSLAAGTYTVVAVGHSSTISATIKSLAMVQFTASDGEKLTDTFSCCQQITVDDSKSQYELPMTRVTAMLKLDLTDEDVPESFAKMKFDYTGGSANFNPTTLQGTTKSTQSETRTAVKDNRYYAYTFPYMADSCSLKVVLSAMSADGTVIRQRTLEKVPVTRNKITTYTGHFFEDGDGDITQSGFGFTINGDWDGEDTYTF